ncbi:hypothetical protein EZY14_006155 [Kordia sp. TARA_039_SRF]|nr:hypothetical protein EZY14_006155 [Kordia sp. TARA_039_SRF]
MRVYKDVLVKYAAALFIPMLIFKLFVWTSEYKGIYALTSSLKNASFRIGAEEGIGVFVLLGILLYKLSEHMIYKRYASRIKREEKQQKLTYNGVLYQIDSYSISKSLRTQLKSEIIIQSYYKHETI